MPITHANWFETFFEGIAVDLWSEAVKGIPTAAEVDYLERQLGIKPGASVLDVPCGAGRHSLELARRGYKVVGVDISKDSIESARAAARDAGLSVDFRLADMRSVAGAFDGAFCFGNSFGYLPHAEMKQFLAALSKALKPGARFVLQTGAVAETLFAALKEEASYQISGIDFRIRNVYDPRNSVLQTQFSFTRDGKTDIRQGWQSIYTSGELCRMLADVGLQTIDLHQDTEGKPFGIVGQYLFLTVERA